MNRRLLFACLLLAGCAIETPIEESEPVERPDRVVHDFELRETLNANLDWVLRANEARYYQEDAFSELDGVRLEFFDADGSTTSTMTSERGKVEDGSGDMIAEGNVILIASSGDTLTTERVHFEKTRDRIRGDQAFRLAKPDRVLTGIGFDAAPDLSDYEVKKNVRIHFRDGVQGGDL